MRVIEVADSGDAPAASPSASGSLLERRRLA